MRVGGIDYRIFVEKNTVDPYAAPAKFVRCTRRLLYLL